MEIDTTLLGIWEKRLKHIPMSLIAKETGLSRHTVKKALSGNCNFSTMQKLNQFLLENKDKQLTNTI